MITKVFPRGALRYLRPSRPWEAFRPQNKGVLSQKLLSMPYLFCRLALRIRPVDCRPIPCKIEAAPAIGRRDCEELQSTRRLSGGRRR